MRLTCIVCNQDACDCNRSKCACGYDVYTLNTIQNTIEEAQVEVKQESVLTNTTNRCAFDGAGVRSKCIYCSQYKYYAGNGYLCSGSQ